MQVGNPKDHDVQKNIPDQLYKIAKESEGSAERVFDQIDVSLNSFEEMQSSLGELMAFVLSEGFSVEAFREQWIERIESLMTQCENGVDNLNGVLDIFQYQDVVRQKLEKVGHQLIEVSDFIRMKLQPETVSNNLPPSGKDILTRNALDADSQAIDVDEIIAQFAKNKT
ncbi:MAG: hypothetical protein CSA81_08800 [Acidobacteria bacterium]|nr:MAG: hypothetical protein CSA81_08800 [Acidobacteriota bacterium]